MAVTCTSGPADSEVIPAELVGMTMTVLGFEWPRLVATQKRPRISGPSLSWLAGAVLGFTGFVLRSMSPKICSCWCE